MKFRAAIRALIDPFSDYRRRGKTGRLIPAAGKSLLEAPAGRKRSRSRLAINGSPRLSSAREKLFANETIAAYDAAWILTSVLTIHSVRPALAHVAMSSEIPTTSVPSAATSMSWFPDVGLHSRSGKQIQESSYAMLWFAAFMFVVAVVFCFIPWEERSFLGNGPKVKYWIAGGFAWGGLCAIGGYRLRNAFGQRIIVDPGLSTMTIASRDQQTIVPLSRVAGVQLCGDANSAFQVNLVYYSEAGEVVRHCLYSHATKRACSRLAQLYHVRCAFTIHDHTDKSGDSF